MGYYSQGSLNGDKKDLVESLSHTKEQKIWDTIGISFGLEDELPRLNWRVLMTSELDDDNPPFTAIALQEEDFTPSTHLLWREE